MKKVIVVGSGIAGLTAAFYVKRCGFDVTLIKPHSLFDEVYKLWQDTGDCGSLSMANRIAQTFTDMGGKFISKSKVKKVNINDGKVTGVTLNNGVLEADAVIKEPGDRSKQYPGDSEYVIGLDFAGHRLKTPEDLSGALISGRQAAQLVCRQFDVVFR